MFCRINPSLYTAAIGHHWAAGQPLWPALHAGGFTDRLLDPSEKHELKTRLRHHEHGSRAPGPTIDSRNWWPAQVVTKKVLKYQPRFVAVVRNSYIAFDRPGHVGLQPRRSGDKLWVLPNPSGLNAHYQPKDLARVFRELRDAVDTS